MKIFFTIKKKYSTINVEFNFGIAAWLSTMYVINFNNVEIGIAIWLITTIVLNLNVISKIQIKLFGVIKMHVEKASVTIRATLRVWVGDCQSSSSVVTYAALPGSSTQTFN
jgi:hypothetical protein